MEIVKINVQINFEDVLEAVDNFSATQKQKLFDKLSNQLFRFKLEQLTKIVKTPVFTEEEIMNEVRAVRYGKD